MTPRPLLRLLQKHPTLRSLGLAVDHFPRYVNRKLRLHALDTVLMTYIVRGRGVHVMDNLRFDETGGSLGITHYGQAHDLLTDAGGMEVYNVLLDLERHGLPQLPPALRGVLGAVLPLHPNLQNALNRRVRLQFADPQRVTPLLARMHDELHHQRPGYADVARDCLQILLVECCRQALRDGLRPGHAPVGATEPHAHVERVRQHLDQHLHRPQRLAHLARLARLSPPQLCRAFKRYTGQSVVQYLNQRRIEAAMIELRSTDAKVAAIGRGCGFPDTTYFLRRFRRTVGCTPTQYRRRAARLEPGGGAGPRR